MVTHELAEKHSRFLILDGAPAMVRPETFHWSDKLPSWLVGLRFLSIIKLFFAAVHFFHGVWSWCQHCTSTAGSALALQKAKSIAARNSPIHLRNFSRIKTQEKNSVVFALATESPFCSFALHHTSVTPRNEIQEICQHLASSLFANRSETSACNFCQNKHDCVADVDTHRWVPENSKFKYRVIFFQINRISNWAGRLTWER